MKNNRPRVLFIGNSQGTAAGLEEHEKYCNYPLLIEDQLPALDCRFWMVSDLSITTISSQYREIVMQHRSDMIILQIGIIEAALRILPLQTRELLRVLPGGRIITKSIYARHGKWLGLLHKLNLHFMDVSLPEFENHLKALHEHCLQDGTVLVFVEIPLLSEQFETEVLIGNNEILSKYNDSLKSIADELNIPTINPFQNNTDESRNTLYLPSSVHFSTLGHQLIAENIKKYISQAVYA